jgi:hypothetical protein
MLLWHLVPATQSPATEQGEKASAQAGQPHAAQLAPHVAWGSAQARPVLVLVVVEEPVPPVPGVPLSLEQAASEREREAKVRARKPSEWSFVRPSGSRFIMGSRIPREALIEKKEDEVYCIPGILCGKPALGFQFAGHAFEGSSPAFLSDERSLVVGALWWGQNARLPEHDRVFTWGRPYGFLPECLNRQAFALRYTSPHAVLAVPRCPRRSARRVWHYLSGHLHLR